MIDERKLMLAQAAFHRAPKEMNGATFAATIAAICLDRADGDAEHAKAILSAAAVLAGFMDESS